MLSQWPQIHDKIQGAGPLAGIVSALKHDPNAAWLVLACDLPYCGEETVAGLVQGRNPYKLATAYRSGYDGFPEPLCAIYEPKSLLRLLHFYGVGYHCPRKALINSDTRILEPVRPEALANVNTPEDREQAERRLAGRSGETRPNDGQS